jgi:hypothetical protein
MTLAAAGLQQAAQQEVVRQAQTQVELHQLAVNAKYADVKPVEPAAKQLSSDVERAAIDAEAEEEAARLPKRPAVDLFKAIFSDDSEDEEAEVVQEGTAPGSQPLPPNSTTTPAAQTPPPKPVDEASSTLTTVAAVASKGPSLDPTAARQPPPSSANSDFISSTSPTTRAPPPRLAQPLELKHHHPLASTTAVSVVNRGSKVQIKLTHLQDDDDDWEEVATSTVGQGSCIGILTITIMPKPHFAHDLHLCA